jgi:lipid-A-disaccharide synthase-like uncharacterized protein
MERPSRWVSILGGVVGGIYVVFGIGEVAAHIDEPASLAFWVPSLLGGGTLVLYGVFGREGVSTRLVVAGALLGIVATAWTLIVPVLSMVLVVCTFHNAQRPPATP